MAAAGGLPTTPPPADAAVPSSLGESAKELVMGERGEVSIFLLIGSLSFFLSA
jgi:hypothetical protein